MVESYIVVPRCGAAKPRSGMLVAFYIHIAAAGRSMIDGYRASKKGEANETSICSRLLPNAVDYVQNSPRGVGCAIQGRIRGYLVSMYMHRHDDESRQDNSDAGLLCYPDSKGKWFVVLCLII